MRGIKLVCGIILFTAVLSVPAFALRPGRIVERGNKFFRAGDYQEALKRYDEALTQEPDSSMIHFNAGTAWYKIKEYESAKGSFESSLATQDKGLESAANYNLGNSKFMLARAKEESDLPAAVQLVEGAVSNFTRALELAAKDQDAQVNLKIAQEELERLKKKLQDQPEQERQRQGKNKEEKEDQSKRGSGRQGDSDSGSVAGDSSQDLEKKSSSASGNEKAAQEAEVKDQEKAQSDADQGSQEEKEAQGSAGEDARKLTRQEALMILDGYHEKEGAVGLPRDEGDGKEEDVAKDW